MALFDVISTAQVNNFAEYEQHVVLSLAINNTNKMQSSWGSVVTDESVELSLVKKQKISPTFWSIAIVTKVVKSLIVINHCHSQLYQRL